MNAKPVHLLPIAFAATALTIMIAGAGQPTPPPGGSGFKGAYHDDSLKGSGTSPDSQLAVNFADNNFVSTDGGIRLADNINVQSVQIDGGLVMAPAPGGTGACLMNQAGTSCIVSQTGSASIASADVSSTTINLTTEGTIDWQTAVGGNTGSVIGQPCGASGVVGNNKIGSPAWFTPCGNFQINPQASDTVANGNGLPLAWSATAADCSTNCTGNATSTWEGISGHAVGSLSFRGPAFPTQLVWRLYLHEFSVTATTCTLSISDGSFSPVSTNFSSGSGSSKAFKVTATYTSASPGAYVYIYCTATLGGSSTPDIGWIFSTLNTI